MLEFGRGAVGQGKRDVVDLAPEGRQGLPAEQELDELLLHQRMFGIALQEGEALEGGCPLEAVEQFAVAAGAERLAKRFGADAGPLQARLDQGA